MRRLSSLISVLLLVSFLLLACNQPPKGEHVIITDQLLPKSGSGETFYLDTVNSWLKLSGFEGEKDRPATFRLRYGKVSANENVVTGGTFIISVASMTVGEADDSVQLRARLQAGDPFDVVGFGTSQFEITGIEPYKPREDEPSLIEGANFSVSGNLQVRNVTKNITFPARIDLDGNTLKARARFDIGRRQWELNYGGINTLAAESAGETLHVELYLEARPEGRGTGIGMR